MNRSPENSPLYILGIESSCDETAAAVVADGRLICSNIISSQVELHARYGGVVPEIASRRHLELINLIIEQALAEARLNLSELDAVAVSSGPGLVGALLVGVSTAKALAYAARLPLIAVNHVEAHLYANFLTGAGVRYPLVALIASGGHTTLLLMPEPEQIIALGRPVMTPPARPSTRSPGPWAWATREGRRSTASPRQAARMRLNFPAPTSMKRPGSTLASAVLNRR